jgi:uncharacterized protein
MPFLIDGHNLIPNVPGLSLQNLDDEMELIEMLQVFGRVRRQKIEVYFDQAAPGHSGARHFGTITAHFVPSGSTADDYIINRLHNLKGSASNFTIVTSDHRIQNEVRSCHARGVTSQAFASELLKAIESDQKSDPAQDKPISPDQVTEWLNLFNRPKKS